MNTEMRLLIAFTLFFAGDLAVGQGLPDTSHGIFSHHATRIWGAHVGLTVRSPDGSKAIVVRCPRNPGPDQMTEVVVMTEDHEYETEIGGWVNAEVAWSPDSQAFFVTYTDGGNVGTYHVKVFYVSDSGLRIVEPIPNGRKLFVPRCYEPEVPNVGAIRWPGQGTSRLLIAVEVPPHSSCADMGTFRAFEITLPEGHVKATFSQLQAKKLFGKDIGEELVGADDSCALSPGACVPNGMKTRK
jgi:hypothetical protein